MPRPAKASKAKRPLLRASGYVDSTPAGNLDTTGSISLINTVAQGAGVSQRIGKKWRMLSCEVKGEMSSNSATLHSTNLYAVVYDKRPTGALPAITDIYDSVSPASHQKDDNKGRFVIVKEWRNSLIGSTASPTNMTFRTLGANFSLGNKLVVNKSAGTGAIGDIEQGALYFLSMGNNAPGTGAATVTLKIRVRFADIQG